MRWIVRKSVGFLPIHYWQTKIKKYDHQLSSQNKLFITNNKRATDLIMNNF